MASLESFLSNIKTSTGDQRDEIISSIDVDDHLPTRVDDRTRPATLSFEDVETFTPPGHWDRTAEGDEALHVFVGRLFPC